MGVVGGVLVELRVVGGRRVPVDSGVEVAEEQAARKRPYTRATGKNRMTVHRVF